MFKWQINTHWGAQKQQKIQTILHFSFSQATCQLLGSHLVVTITQNMMENKMSSFVHSWSTLCLPGNHDLANIGDCIGAMNQKNLKSLMARLGSNFTLWSVAKTHNRTKGSSILVKQKRQSKKNREPERWWGLTSEDTSSLFPSNQLSPLVFTLPTTIILIITTTTLTPPAPDFQSPRIQIKST